MDPVRSRASLQNDPVNKPLPHKLSPRLASVYCDFKLNLRPLRYSSIHRGIKTTCPRWILRSNVSTTHRTSSIVTFWKPYLRKLFEIVIPTVHAKEAEQPEGTKNEKDETKNEQDELAMKLRENYGYEKPLDELAMEYMEKESGWERLQEMYGHYEGYGGNHMSPELTLMIKQIFNTSILLGIVGFLAGSHRARLEFAERHYHTKWRTKFTAARAYNDAQWIGGLTTGGRFALKMAVFVGVWIWVSTTISVYRNKSGILEHTAGAAVGGAVGGLNMGLKGMFARGVIGSFFGTTLGLVFYPIQAYYNDRQQDKRFWITMDRLQQERDVQSLIGEDDDLGLPGGLETLEKPE